MLFAVYRPGFTNLINNIDNQHWWTKFKLHHNTEQVSQISSTILTINTDEQNSNFTTIPSRFHKSHQQYWQSTLMNKIQTSPQYRAGFTNLINNIDNQHWWTKFKLHHNTEQVSQISSTILTINTDEQNSNFTTIPSGFHKSHQQYWQSTLMNKIQTSPQYRAGFTNLINNIDNQHWWTKFKLHHNTEQVSQISSTILTINTDEQNSNFTTIPSRFHKSHQQYWQSTLMNKIQTSPQYRAGFTNLINNIDNQHWWTKFKLHHNTEQVSQISSTILTINTDEQNSNFTTIPSRFHKSHQQYWQSTLMNKIQTPPQYRAGFTNLINNIDNQHWWTKIKLHHNTEQVSQISSTILTINTDEQNSNSTTI